MLELIGILGGFLFAAGCVPMAIRTWKAGKDIGTPLETQWLLFFACILYSIFLFGTFGTGYIAFWFLIVEVACWGVALWYHYYPRGWVGPEEHHQAMMGDTTARNKFDGGFGRPPREHKFRDGDRCICGVEHCPEARINADIDTAEFYGLGGSQ